MRHMLEDRVVTAGVVQLLGMAIQLILGWLGVQKGPQPFWILIVLLQRQSHFHHGKKVSSKFSPDEPCLPGAFCYMFVCYRHLQVLSDVCQHLCR